MPCVLNNSGYADRFVWKQERVHIPIVTKYNVRYTACSILEGPHDSYIQHRSSAEVAK